MKSINEYLHNTEMIFEGKVNLTEARTIIIFLGMYKNYKNVVKPESIKFIEDTFEEDEIDDIIEELGWWDDNPSIGRSYNYLYKNLYGDKLIKLCDYCLGVCETSHDKKSWTKIKTELEKIHNKGK